MKKNILKTFILSLLVAYSCVSQISEDKSLIIVYKAQTRGSNVLIKFKNDSIFYKTESIKKVIALNIKQIESIKKEVKKINLPIISSLKAPSSKRFSDGALVATFQIIFSGKQYTSSEFDHENPPKKLLQLYLLLLKYTN